MPIAAVRADCQARPLKINDPTLSILISASEGLPITDVHRASPKPPQSTRNLWQ